jgi:hypothetical protein
VELEPEMRVRATRPEVHGIAVAVPEAAQFTLGRVALSSQPVSDMGFDEQVVGAVCAVAGPVALPAVGVGFVG